MTMVKPGDTSTYDSLDGMNGAILGKVRRLFQSLLRSSAAASDPPRLKAME